MKFLACLFVFATLLCAGAARAGSPPLDIAAQARALGRGINALGFDPLWDDPAKARFGPAEFRAIRAAGFSTVRVNLFTFRHLDSDGRLDPRWLASLDAVVATGTAAGLNLILEVQDMKACAQTPDACIGKLLSVWSELAERYRDAPSSILFEPLNEPNTTLDPIWNAWLPEVLGVIRRSDPTRAVVVDTTGWASLGALSALRLPDADRRLIVSIHYYEPRAFTHQGAPWAPDTRDRHDVAWGSPAERARLHADFDRAEAWSRAAGRPILLGEFGAYDAAPMESRARYLDAVAREAEAHGWSWADWQFDHDFAAWNASRRDWVAPVLHALIPESRPSGWTPGA